MSAGNDYKGMARALREALAEKKIHLGHGQCLELVARTVGYRNWNVLASKLQETPAVGRGAPDACSFCGLPGAEGRRMFAGPTTSVCEACVQDHVEYAENREVLERLPDASELAAYLDGRTVEQLERYATIARRRLTHKRTAIEQLGALAAGVDSASVQLAPGVERMRWRTLAARPRSEVAALRDHQKAELALTEMALKAALAALDERISRTPHANAGPGSDEAI
jgi:hypothetical protein